jgi:peptide deformylase
MLRILHYPDPMLLIPTVPVEQFDSELVSYVNQMIVTMDSYGAVGLAANQTGDPRRVCVTRFRNYRNGLSCIWVNPRIVHRHHQVNGKEGCLSFPGMELEVIRSGAITVEYQDMRGTHLTETLVATETFMTVILQHEIDHLDGRVFIDPTKCG